ncbi:SDR family oxidoreductase [Acidisoma cellulosilyticum]|uniref:SDR family oxidoreductase n=1 Tax=Acidisoma cellulosilyticum TaxID=2802395 RepID=UPI001D0B02BA|nr:SDR family oxidoreductase [Acidisoma cellulosilyticum]
MTLNAKTVVVLGGTSGIGFAIAEGVAAAGGKPIIVSRSQANVDAALSKLPQGAEGHAVDLTDEAALAALFATIGTLDHLAYTAGESLMMGPLTEMDLTAARRFTETRFWGAVAAAKHAAPRIRPGGSIVFSSGIAGARPPQGGWSMGASICAGMEGLTRALAIELAPTRVNLVSPGFIRTPLWRDIPEADREALFASVGAKLPVGRVGEPGEIAAAYLFLMQAGFTTGHVLVADGGGLLV